MEKITLEAGCYIIGDPLFFSPKFEDSFYALLLDKTSNIVEVLSMLTFYGETSLDDGIFITSGELICEIPVDSGVICMTKYDNTFKKFCNKQTDVDSCIIVEFEKDVEVSYENGIFSFGNKLCIDTNGD